ncbi:MAG: hypothetical protein K2M31_05395 [Muribaculaceae bacterium]|nr:hypothetical protein [Muribaculaceae bacterium]
MTSKEIQLRLTLPSSLPDLTCPDGEVASFSNVDWLQKLADSDKNNDKSPLSTRLSVALTPTGIMLPAGSELIAIHEPAENSGDSGLRYIIRTPPDALAIYSPSTSLSYLHASVSTLAGKIHRALVFSNFILLLTEKGPRWIVYDPSDNSYTLTTENPAPPEVSFNLSPVALDGYSLIAGRKPELEVATDIPESLNASESMFAQWFEAGSGTAVKEEVRRLVFAAVGKTIVDFESMVRGRGLYLTSPRCLAALTAYSDADAVLPTPRTIPSCYGTSDYTPPVARLLSWSFHATTLRLRIQFSLIPMRLSASFNVPESRRLWMRQFQSILFAATDSPRWHDKGQSLSASALTSWTDPDSGVRNGYAFRFADALTSDQLSIRTQRLYDYRILGRAPIDDALSGLIALSGLNYRLNYQSMTETAAKYNPDYRDLTIPDALDGITTDRGFALFKNNTLLASHKKYPFIFRHCVSVGDAPILALFRSSKTSGRTLSARHPLHVISADGIRHIESDSEGEFQPTRFLSHLPGIAGWPTATAPDRLFFMSPEGLATLSLSGTITLLDIPASDIITPSTSDIITPPSASIITPPTADIIGPSASDIITPPTNMIYSTLISTEGSKEALILSFPGRTFLYDLNQKRLQPQPSISIQSILLHNSIPKILLPDGTLTRLSHSQIQEALPFQEDASKDTQEASPMHEDASKDTQEAPPMHEDASKDTQEPLHDLDCGPIEMRAEEAKILTRPLKLGNPFIPKRILSIQAAHPSISINIQASNDLASWHTIANYSPDSQSPIPTSPRLHLIPARYFRLILTCPESLSSCLQLLSIRYRHP